ncbi:hypothetical protein HanXRQr2_Chr14g0663271 [Helianthus annuus]|uniref:Uncharacterized protein n=1 Tax=Helianthus annuus TaxID=4232 RepID=A0A9K3EC12_HELAN|nr:hypothetical protein HanXRQr2_Chr14g0663271 [Helianthus annuus]KAJ0470522.1 hypothetical protein HanIR_Chr14g0719671 [Helianthus annuus]KAJ0841983.1 hypothetical protein HanPSC8_Chr14g0636541 [Helianthus annuus]
MDTSCQVFRGGMVIRRYDGEFAGSGEAVIDQDNLKTFCGHKV